MGKEKDLVKAARNGDLEKVKRLLNEGANINALYADEYHRMTALHRAASRGHTQVVSLLLERGADINAKDEAGYTPLHLACGFWTNERMCEHLEVVTLLLARGARVNDNDKQPLSRAVAFGHIQAASLLLKYKADINAKDKDGDTPLHVVSGGWRIGPDLESKTVSFLLEHGADIDAKNNEGKTPKELAIGKPIFPLFVEHAKLIEEKKKQAKEDQVIAQYTSVLTNFQKALEQPKLIDVEYLSAMFQQANDVCMFRFPYTLAIIFRQEAPQLIEKTDTLILHYLRELAQTYIKGPRVYSIFVNVILKSATKRGIIDKITEGELAKIADNTETLSDQRFAELLHKVDTLQKRVENVEHNIQTLAKEFNGLKEALKRKSKRDAIFGFAKMVLSLVGIQAVDMIAGIADFTDLSSISDVMFGLPIEEIGQGLLANNKMIIKEFTGTLLKKAGLDPNDYLKVWYESHLLLETAPAQPTVIPISYESSISPAHPKLFISTSEEVSDKVTSVALSASPQTLFALKPVAKIALKAVPRDPIPAAASSLPTTSSFEDWLKTVQSFGKFDLNVSEKKLVIQFTSSQKTVSEITKLINALDEYLEKIPELEQVALDRDIDEHNRLIITTKTTLGAKRLKTILEEQYILSGNASVAMTSPSTTLASLHI